MSKKISYKAKDNKHIFNTFKEVKQVTSLEKKSNCTSFFTCSKQEFSSLYALYQLTCYLWLEKYGTRIRM